MRKNLSPRGERGRGFVALALVVASSSFAEGGPFGRSQLGGVGLQRTRSAEVAPHSLGAGVDVGFFRVPALTQSGGTDELHLTQYGVFFSPAEVLELAVAARSATLQQPASPRGYYFLVNDLF